MKTVIPTLSLLFFLFSCAKKSEDAMQVSGNIEGLKKGVLFLQKIQDSTLITIDSIEIRGDGMFSFEHTVEQPDLFYLYLEKADNNDINDRIAFFGEAGEVTITSTWDQFESKARISGSESHEEYAGYLQMMSEFNKRDLELAQAAFSETDPAKVDSIEQLAERNYVNRFRYLLNFGLTNPDSYVTPYVTLKDGTDANPLYLDSIYGKLSEEVANSKYGKALDNFINTLE